MARIDTTIGTPFEKAVRRLWELLAKALNGNISFGDGTSPDNINGVWISVNTTIANFVVTHNLGRIPVGWLLVNKNGFEDIKQVSSTTTTLTLAGLNGGIAVKLFIF